jgi:NADPH2:quinone reductase
LLLPIPGDLSFASAAALPETFATSYLTLFQEAGLAAGETVLIHAGASGVGTAAIQLAREHGCRVVTTVGGQDKVRAVSELGADVVIDHRIEDVSTRLRELTAQKPGIDVVLDCIGGTELGSHLSWMNADGRWVVIALLAGYESRLDLRAVLSKRLRLLGSTLRSRTVERKVRVLRGLEAQFWPALAESRIRPVIHAVLPVARVEEAHSILERRENVGKVVLQIEA